MLEKVVHRPGSAPGKLIAFMRRRSDSLLLGLTAILAFSICACRKDKSVLYSSESRTQPSNAYRLATAADGLECGYRTSQLTIEYSWGSGGPRPVPSGTLIDFHCTKSGASVTKTLELASFKMVQGAIETKQFGTIQVDGAPFTGENHLYLTEDQITKIKNFLDQ